jgi:bile acid:Na+ symporter, BASS family
MTDINSIQINFDQGQVVLLNICLGFLMFGVALDLKMSDFSYVLTNRKAVLSGLVSQWILLPILTILLVWVFRPEYSIALGMILIAACPGGNVSNYAVHLSGANVALSVVLTMISTIFCALSTPFIFAQLRKFIPDGHAGDVIFDISFINMISTIVQLILLPLVVGYICVTFFPMFVNKIKGFVKKLSLLIFIGFVIAAVAGNLDNLKNYIGLVFFIVLIHNGLALAVGYFFSKSIMNLPSDDAKAISIETGIQNSGLALILIFNFFDGMGGMALIAAWWSVWHLISSLTLAIWWKGRNKASVL